MLEQVREKRIRVVIVDSLFSNGSGDIALVLGKFIKALQCCLVHDVGD